MIKLDKKTSIVDGFIYKISSTDNKMNYYGLTTQKDIQIRFNRHLEDYTQFYYNINHNLQQNIDFCASFIIFNNYNIHNIQSTIIEQHTNITLKELQNREKYYIQNFDCINILGKKQQTHFYNNNNQLILTHNINDTIIIQQQSKDIIPIIQLLGYTIYYSNNTYIHIKHIKQTNLSNIKTQIKLILQQKYNLIPSYYTQILDFLNNILKQHNLQLLTQRIYYYKTIYYKLLLYPNIPIPLQIETQIQQKQPIQSKTTPLTPEERKYMLEEIYNNRHKFT
jgi:hypothetical protein